MIGKEGIVMNVIVTGGSGHTGKAVFDHLIGHGYDATIVDIVRPENDYAPYKLCDLADFGQAIDVLRGAEAIVHLAAIPRPTNHPNHVVFRTNVLATYNVFEAAAALGIERVVYASSISVTGYPFYEKFFEPQYVPIDEAHPPAPQDAYALSKHIGEEIAQAFVRRTGMIAISLRLPWIHTPETFQEEIVPYRDDPKFGASNLWLYVDARDVAQAFRLCLETNLQGYHDFYIGAPDTFMDIDSVELVKSFYPNTEIRPSFNGTQSLISSSRAEHLLGYRAENTWRGYL
jgi:nucleoside-diphosphate-sugar epimerase